MTYFLKTVPEITDTTLDIASKLRLTVNNTGNYFFEHAVEKHVHFDRVIHNLNEITEADSSLVLSMSNFISPTTDLGDIAGEIEDRKIAKITMIGAGAQAYDYNEKIKLTAGTRRFLDLLSERSNSIGVRGEFTAHVLSSFGIKNVDIIGCPSVFFQCDPSFKIEKQSNLKSDHRSIFHCTPVGYYKDSVSALFGLGRSVCEAYVAQSEQLLFGLNSDNQKEVAETDYFFRYFANSEDDYRANLAWFISHTKWFFKLDEWLNYMGDIDFAFGTRFHGNMAAIVMGVPALNLVFDTRTKELVEYLNLPYLDFAEINPATTISNLFDAADFDLFNRSYPIKYTTYRDFLISNGLQTKLPPASHEKQQEINPASLSALHKLISDIAHTGYIKTRLIEEVRLRLSSLRGEEVRKTIESGSVNQR